MKNNRTFLEKLLDGAEVEWKPVKSLCNDNFWLMPATPEFDDNGTIPYITSKNIKGGKIDFQNTKYINEHVYQELSRTRCIVENDILISMIGTIGEAAIVKQEDLFFYGQNMYILRLNNKLVNHKFFLYYFTAPFILNSLLSKKNSSNQGYLKAGQIENLKIPIPPLSVQTEIVKILDALTALTSELTSELTLRRKQYEYYREKLLSEEELGKVGFEWKCLKNIFNIFAGGDVPKEFYSQHKTQEFNIPILSNGTGNKSLYGWTNKAKINKPSLTISARGTIGWTSYREEPFYPIVRLLVLTPKIELNLKYAYHFMKMIEKNYKVPESGIPQLTKPMIEDLRIPVPSFSEQQSIASILDKFETLTHSITEGLPLAIQQSQKRYEYYRELLLNFPGRE